MTVGAIYRRGPGRGNDPGKDLRSVQPWLVYDVRLLRDILRFWPGRVLGPIAAIVVVVLAGMSLQFQQVWQAAPPPLQDLVLTATPIPITSPFRVHDAPSITVLNGDFVGPRSIAELVESWVAGESAPAPLLLKSPEIVIGGSAQETEEIIEGLPSGGSSIVAISNGLVRWPLVAGGELRFEAVEARIEVSRGGAVRIPDGTAMLAGRKFAFALEAGPSGVGANEHSLRLTLTSKELRVGFNGVLTSKGTVLEAGRFRVATDDASDVAAWLGLSLDGISGRVVAEGALSVESGLVSLEQASFAIGGNRGEGSIRLQVTRGRPLVDATLAFAQLDLGGAETWLRSRFAEPAEALARKPAGSAAKLLEAIDVDLRLSADTIRVGELATGHGAISATWRDKGLTVQLAGLDIYGGGASGQLDLRPRSGDPTAELALKLDSVDLRSLLSAMGLEAPLDANSHVAVALTAAGRSWREARERLSGEIAVRATERALMRGGLQRAALAAMGRAGELRGAGQAVDGLDWKIAIENGIIARQSLAFDVNGIRYGAGAEASKDESSTPVTIDAHLLSAR